MVRFSKGRDSGGSSRKDFGDRRRSNSRDRSGSGRDYADRRGKGDFRGSSRKDSGERSGRSDSRRGPKMHKTVCDECGENCEVPFNPTEGKPIYCSECFKKKGGSSKDSTKEFEEINDKLDKIMAALKIDKSE